MAQAKGPSVPNPLPVLDVDEASFQTEVIERSRQVPVLVDFWAAWCGPCRTLGPMLESAVARRGGEVLLAKVDVDANPGLARGFRVQGIPQVVGIRDGRVVTQFTGAVPPAELERHLDALVPSEADRAVARASTLQGVAAVAELRRALELDPSHREAAIALADALVASDPDEARRLVEPHRPDPSAEAVLTRLDLARSADADVDSLRARLDGGERQAGAHLELGRALAGRGAYEEAVEHLLRAVELGGETREPAREQLVAVFGILGDHPVVASARPRLARALF